MQKKENIIRSHVIGSLIRERCLIGHYPAHKDRNNVLITLPRPVPFSPSYRVALMRCIVTRVCDWSQHAANSNASVRGFLSPIDRYRRIDRLKIWRMMMDLVSSFWLRSIWKILLLIKRLSQIYKGLSCIIILYFWITRKITNVNCTSNILLYIYEEYNIIHSFISWCMENALTTYQFLPVHR